MAKINNKTQAILENMIVGKFEDKRKALVEEIDAIKNRDYEITTENKEKCKDSIVRVVEKAQNDIAKLLKTCGLEIGHKFYEGEHFTYLVDSDGEIKSNWKEYIRPIAKKSAKQEALEQELETLLAKCKKAMDELILRASLGCKYSDVMEFINNLEV
jgi:vacuolar-type H+-ATPase subunit I/STV1